MRRYLLLFLGILIGLNRGFEQGMIMVQNKDIMHVFEFTGLRGHLLFDWFHLISFLSLILLVVFGILIIKARLNFLYIIGILVLLWSFSEFGYNISRYNTLIVKHEHINFLDLVSINLSGFKCYLVHIVRMIMGFAFLNVRS